MRLLASPRLGEVLRYGLATGLSAVVTLGLPVLLHQFLGVRAPVAVGIAFATAFVVNFVSTRTFVFKSKGHAREELARYVITSAGFRIAEYLAFLALYSIGFVYYIAQLIVVATSLFLKFAAFKLFVYRKPARTAASND